MSVDSASHPGVPDRRSRKRGTPDEPSREELVARILGTFGEMPGLQLTLPQVVRLFGIGSTTCQVVLGDLVRAGRLRQTSSASYARP